MNKSYTIYGIKVLDEKYKKMKLIHDLCVEEGVEIPREVEYFFEWSEPNPDGVRVPILGTGMVKEEIDGNRTKLTLDLALLPAHVKFMIFTIGD